MTVSRIEATNFKLDALLPDKYNLSPDSKINFPVSKFTVSLNGIGKALNNSVSTAPLFKIKVISYEVVALIFATWANNTTAEYPTGAVYIRVDVVGTTDVTVLNIFVFNAMSNYAPSANINGVSVENKLLE